MADKISSHKVVCAGGLVTNASDLDLSDSRPGAGINLVNFEPSLFGGYRKLNGYTPWDATKAEVDPTNAEGPVLVVANLGTDLIVARKQTADTSYKYYKWDGSDWAAYTTSFTLTATNVTRIRFVRYNFSDVDKLIFVDGVNKPVIFDGTDFIQLSSTATGADIDNAGGAQMIDAPKYVDIFFNTIFLAGDPSFTVVAYSAPSKDYDWTAASGAGQIVTGFECTGIKPWRESNYIFGLERIKRIELNNSLNFVLKDVATEIGCIAPDTIQEIGGDLIYLSQDGFRPISGTDKIGDVELETVSRAIQSDLGDLISTTTLTDVTSVIVRSKSQIRFFFNDASTEPVSTPGILGGLRTGQQGLTYEWAKIRGIRANCCTSFYRGNTEYIVHGDYNGKVYRQEQGHNFDGLPINAVYATPYLDLGDTGVRKTFRTVRLFVRPEGDATISTKVEYDWDNDDHINPDTYASATHTSGSTYGTAVYGVSVYGGKSSPILLNNVQGSGFSTKFTFTDFSDGASYSIQAILFDFSVDGRK